MPATQSRPAFGDPRLPPNFWSWVMPVLDGCWIWFGCTDKDGYGRFDLPVYARIPGQRATRLPHRLAYSTLVAEIPRHLDCDHLCRQLLCVNPAHIEPVTPTENKRRGIGICSVNAKKNQCHRGHEFTPENTRLCPRKTGSVSRACRTCLRQSNRLRIRTR
jgi:hypothetical protein